MAASRSLASFRSTPVFPSAHIQPDSGSREDERRPAGGKLSLRRLKKSPVWSDEFFRTHPGTQSQVPLTNKTCLSSASLVWAEQNVLLSFNCSAKLEKEINIST